MGNGGEARGGGEGRDEEGLSGRQVRDEERPRRRRTAAEEDEGWKGGEEGGEERGVEESR